MIECTQMLRTHHSGQMIAVLTLHFGCRHFSWGFSSWSTIYGNIGEPSEKSASNRKVILVNQKTDRESKTFTVHLFAPISLGSPIFSRPIRSTEKNLPKFFSQKQIYLICFLCFINQLNLSLFSFYRNLFLHFS